MKAYFSLFLLSLLACKSNPERHEAQKIPKDFISIDNTHFTLNGKSYYFLGTNFWYGMNLGSRGSGGNRERLIRELDSLSSIGVNNLRICAGSEGPDTEPWRMLPSLQPSPGKYNPEVIDGLDFLLNEMKKRNMKAIMCLNNFWPWSGGMGQYLVWAGAAASIPYPPPQPGGDWKKYPEFVATFYSNQKAMALFDKHITFLVTRKNPYSDIDYKNDPTIMAWELANEPRGVNNMEAFYHWIDNTAAHIKKLDSNHLVTTGSEGKTSDQKSSGTDLEKDHSSSNIDYATIHIWIQNWEWYNPANATVTYPIALKKALNYMEEHIEIAKKLKKPLVLEEFGISRDRDSHDPVSSTTIRDKYYARIFEEVYNHANMKDSELAGVNFWAWAGEGRPRSPKAYWKLNDDFIGDPPHETQGWYSVYNTDTSTISIIKKYTAQFDKIGSK
jgi:mannan endo-1,4-beta-mannosidase